MKNMKIILVVVFSLFLSCNAFAASNEVTVQAEGVGSDYDEAISNAIENAVRQTSTVKVSKTAPDVKASASLTHNSEKENSFFSSKKNSKTEASVKVKQIDMKYSGKVKSYEVLESSEKGGSYTVKIKAVVEKVDDYKSPDLVTKAKDKLVIMPFKGNNSYKCAGSSISLDRINSTLTNKLTSKLSKTKKFSIVDRRNLDNYAQEALLIAADLTQAKDKNKLQNIAAADYMIVGTINDLYANTKTERIEVLDEIAEKTKAELSVEYSIVEVATTEVIFSEYAEVVIRKEKGIKNCNKILDELADKVTNQIAKDSMETIFPDYEYVAKEKQKPIRQKTIHDAPKKKQVTKLPFDR